MQARHSGVSDHNEIEPLFMGQLGCARLKGSTGISALVIFIVGSYSNFPNEPSEFDIDDVTETGFTSRSGYQQTSWTPKFFF